MQTTTGDDESGNFVVVAAGFGDDSVTERVAGTRMNSLAKNSVVADAIIVVAGRVCVPIGGIGGVAGGVGVVAFPICGLKSPAILRDAK